MKYLILIIFYLLFTYPIAGQEISVLDNISGGGEAFVSDFSVSFNKERFYVISWGCDTLQVNADKVNLIDTCSNVFCLVLFTIPCRSQPIRGSIVQQVLK